MSSYSQKVTIILSILGCGALGGLILVGVAQQRIHESTANTEKAERQVRLLGGHIDIGNRRGEHFVYLADTEVCDEDLKRLEPYLLALPAFKTINLSATRISDVGVSYLTRFRSLESIGLDRTAVTEQGVMQLHAELPSCVISYTHDGELVVIGGPYGARSRQDENLPRR